MENVTFGDILDDFKRENPNMADQIVGYRPHSHLKIMIWLKDGRILIYDYLNKRGRFDLGRWKE